MPGRLTVGPRDAECRDTTSKCCKSDTQTGKQWNVQEGTVCSAWGWWKGSFREVISELVLGGIKKCYRHGGGTKARAVRQRE